MCVIWHKIESQCALIWCVRRWGDLKNSNNNNINRQLLRHHHQLRTSIDLHQDPQGKDLVNYSFNLHGMVISIPASSSSVLFVRTPPIPFVSCKVVYLFIVTLQVLSELVGKLRSCSLYHLSVCFLFIFLLEIL